MSYCPRRIEDGAGPGGPFHCPEEDTYRDGRCSYCGSLSGDEIMRRIEAGEEVGPTDKSYKIYLGNNKGYFQHLSEAQMKRFVELLNEKKINIGVPGYFYTRPFFITRKPKGPELTSGPPA